MPIRVHARWVKSHQTNCVTREGRLNRVMDRLVAMLVGRLVDTWTGWWTGWLDQLGNHSVLRFQAGFRSVQSHSQT